MKLSTSLTRAGLVVLCLTAGLSRLALANQDPIRVAAIGDSLTEGDGDEAGLGGYVGRLQKSLQSKNPKAQVKNLGHSGWTSEMVVKGYEGKPSTLKEAISFKPHIALVWIGSNDLWYLYEYADPKPEDERQDLLRYQKNLQTIVGSLSKSGTKVLLASLDDQSQRPVARQGKAFSGISKSEMQRMGAQVKLYNQAIANVAKQNGAKVVNLSDPSLWRSLAEDGNHPNASGYEKITQVWLKAFGP